MISRVYRNVRHTLAAGDMLVSHKEHDIVKQGGTAEFNPSLAGYISAMDGFFDVLAA